MKINKTIEIEPPKLLAFKDRGELIKTLLSLPNDMVVLIGYVDKNGDVRRFSLKDLALSKKQYQEELVKKIERGEQYLVYKDEILSLIQSDKEEGE